MYYKIVFAIFLITLIWGNGYSQQVYYEQYTDADGLPSMTIYEMVQDSNGVLWMGTENGLVSFDGETFKTYTHPDLQDNDIIQLELSKDGDILFSNLSHQISKIENDGIQIIFSGQGKNYFLFSSKNNDFVLEDLSTITEVSRVVYKIEQNQLKFYTKMYSKLDESRRRSSILSANIPENQIYCMYVNDSIYLFKHEKRKEYEKLDTTIFNEFQFDNINYNSGNQFFITKSNEKSIALLHNKEACYISNNFSANYKAIDIQRVVIIDDKYFVVLHNSLELFDPKSTKKRVLLENIVVNTVFIDKENNIWVSTRENGLLKFLNIDLNFNQVPKYEQIITGVYASDDYVLILWGDKIVIRNKENREVYSADFETNKKNVIDVSDNVLDIAYSKNFTSFKSPTNIVNSKILDGPSKAIAFSKSTLYTSVKKMVVGYKYIDTLGCKKILERTKKIRLENVYTMKYSENQNFLLAGTTKGLYKIDQDDNITEYMQELRLSNISDIIETGDSSFWISTKNEGIYKIKNNKVVQHFDINNGLLTNNINDLDIQDNYVYAASTNGVIQINTNTLTVINKNSNSGLPSDNITNLAIFNDSIWIAIQKDIIVMDSTFFANENVSSTISLDKFYCNNNLIDYQKGMSFPYDENKIDISFRNISLSSGSNRELKYRIPNLDQEWVYTKESIIRLPSLQPSRYHVEAIGINAEGIESEPLHLDFRIKPAWWNTLWAKIIGILCMIVIASIIIKIRDRRIRKEESTKRNYLTQINKIKDQALQLQMNPHFIFNSLNAIQGFIGTEEEEMAMNYLARFARLIRLIFEHSKGNTITLEEELEFINLYLNLEKLRFKDKVNIEVIIGPELEASKDIINVPPLLIQPIVENSFKHGLFHKKGKGNLKIEYTLQNEIMKIVIEDDGIGRKESIRISEKNPEKQTSSGIKTTIERIDLLNFGKENRLNTVEVEDLYDEDGNALGTRTILILSIK